MKRINPKRLLSQALDDSEELGVEERDCIERSSRSEMTIDAAEALALDGILRVALNQNLTVASNSKAPHSAPVNGSNPAVATTGSAAAYYREDRFGMVLLSAAIVILVAGAFYFLLGQAKFNPYQASNPGPDAPAVASPIPAGDGAKPVKKGDDKKKKKGKKKEDAVQKKERIKKLAMWLTDEDPDLSEMAFNKLKNLGIKAFPEVREALQNQKIGKRKLLTLQQSVKVAAEYILDQDGGVKLNGQDYSYERLKALNDEFKKLIYGSLVASANSPLAPRIVRRITGDPIPPTGNFVKRLDELAIDARKCNIPIHAFYAGTGGPEHILSLGTDKTEYALGEGVQISLRIPNPAMWQQTKDQMIFAKVIGIKGETMVQLKPDSQGLPVFRGRYSARQVGYFGVEAKLMPPKVTKGSKPLFWAKHRFRVSSRALKGEKLKPEEW